MFGEPSISTAVTESDTLSAVEFDKQGDHIAVGDKTGRIIIFKRCVEVEENENEFNYLCEFQAHETEFDYLRSQEIEEKVNKVKWLWPSQHLNLLSTNDHTIKLWRLRAESIFSENAFKNIQNGAESEEEWKSRSKNYVKIPLGQKQQGEFKASIRRTFVEGHEFNIHSLSPCEDGIHFISADDLKINL